MKKMIQDIKKTSISCGKFLSAAVFFCIGLGCQKLVFFLALVKLHNLRLRFADGVRVNQAPQTRRFRPFCSGKMYCVPNTAGQSVLAHWESVIFVNRQKKKKKKKRMKTERDYMIRQVTCVYLVNVNKVLKNKMKKVTEL